MYDNSLFTVLGALSAVLYLKVLYSKYERSAENLMIVVEKNSTRFLNCRDFSSTWMILQVKFIFSNHYTVK